MIAEENLQNESNILKVIAHPVRLCIIRKLIENPCNVSKIYTCLKKPQSTISQHLGKLKAANIIKGERKGTEICYCVINNQVKEIIHILFSKT